MSIIEIVIIKIVIVVMTDDTYYCIIEFYKSKHLVDDQLMMFDNYKSEIMANFNSVLNYGVKWI